jgi:hypothetical protein
MAVGIVVISSGALAAGTPSGGQSTQMCKQTCQRQYDERITNCAGYRLGNTAPACKDPLTKTLNECLKACR